MSAPQVQAQIYGLSRQMPETVLWCLPTLLRYPKEILKLKLFWRIIKAERLFNKNQASTLYVVNLRCADKTKGTKTLDQLVHEWKLYQPFSEIIRDNFRPMPNKRCGNPAESKYRLMAPLRVR